MFGVSCWSRSLERAYKEEKEYDIEAALLTVGAGAVESAGWKANRRGFFVEVLRDMRRLLEVDQSILDQAE